MSSCESCVLMGRKTSREEELIVTVMIVVKQLVLLLFACVFLCRLFCWWCVCVAFLLGLFASET